MIHRRCRQASGLETRIVLVFCFFATCRGAAGDSERGAAAPTLVVISTIHLINISALDGCRESSSISSAVFTFPLASQQPVNSLAPAADYSLIVAN